MTLLGSLEGWEGLECLSQESPSLVWSQVCKQKPVAPPVAGSWCSLTGEQAGVQGLMLCPLRQVPGDLQPPDGHSG